MLFPLAGIFAVLGTWNIAVSASDAITYAPPGVLVPTSGGPSLHLFCDGPVNASATILFLHGFTGSQVHPNALYFLHAVGTYVFVVGRHHVGAAAP